jgi:glycosyltransferase involved in cell wall biosynthesis
MNAAGQTLCLNMIVKNEAGVICRCLDSVRPIVDHWVIVDTGSTDGTQDIIRQHLRDLPGELHERPWLDFAHNRSEALELARGKSDYTLIIDADDTLEFEPDTHLPALTADFYTFDIADTGIAYRRTQLVRSALPWLCKGVTLRTPRYRDARNARYRAARFARPYPDGTCTRWIAPASPGAPSGDPKKPIADWFHIAMRLQHAKQAASGLSTNTPGRMQAKAAIVAEVERLRGRIWNGKAKNARREAAGF